MNEQILQMLKNKAVKYTTYESFDDGIDFRDHFCGDVDDAYDAGSDDGEIEFAREILKQLGIEYDK